MTNRRAALLNNTVQFFGHEHPTTIEIFTISERCPEEQFDDTISYLFNCRMHDHIAECYNSCEADEEGEYIDYSDESGFDPYIGCYTGDC